MLVEENVALRGYNSFGIEATARRIVEVTPSVDDLRQLHEIVDGSPWMVLGQGCNTVFSGDYEGTIVRVGRCGVQAVVGNMMVVDAGMIFDDLISCCIDMELYGLENLSAIPGTVGAAMVQNVGAYGVEVQEYVVWVEAYDMKLKRIVRLSREDCTFGYRSSLFKRCAGKYIIFRVAFKLNTDYSPRMEYKALEGLPCSTALELREAITALRWSKLPRPEEYGSVGSFFKNPVVDAATAKRMKEENPGMPLYDGRKLSAGWLIEQCGWKGRTMGRVGVWPKQALILYNAGGCTGAEVVALSEAIQESVLERFGISLEPEAIII